jgi:hypothetical protein
MPKRVKVKFTIMSGRPCSHTELKDKKVIKCPRFIKENVKVREQAAHPVGKCYYHIQVAKDANGRKHRNLKALTDPIATQGQ